jgi:hypothetical protein
MADISVTFIHPTSGKPLSVTLDDAMTAKEAVEQLLQNQFVPPHQNGYELGVKGGARMRSDETFVAAGVKSGTSIQVLPATEAGN